MPLLLAVVAAIATAVPADATRAPRVASLNLTSDEVLVEILPPGQLVSVTTFADERGTSNVVGRVPASVPRLKADLERLIALKPDLVVVSEYTDPDFLELLRRSGLRAHRMEGLRDPPGYRRAILALGDAVGARPRAEALVARFDARLAELGRLLSGARRPRVFYWAGGMTAGAGTAIGALIESAGATNVGAEMGLEGIARVGAERAFVADPDVILLGTWPGVRDDLLRTPLLSRLRAVREGRIVEMPTELLVTLSHHAADASWHLAHALHPDRVPPPRR